MPLLHGSSDEILGENIAELRRAGHPEDQALAIALRKQREANLAEQQGGGLADAARNAAATRAAQHAAADAADKAGAPAVLKQGASDGVAEVLAEGVTGTAKVASTGAKRDGDEINKKQRIRPHRVDKTGAKTSR